jgi:hypothetical protein
MAALVIGTGAAFAAEPSEEESDPPKCSIVYEGDFSRFGFCDDASIVFERDRPEDMVRIDKPLKPGPNSLPREVEEKVIRKPAKAIAKVFGW